MHPLAPVNLTSVVLAWNATVLWDWEHKSYLSQALICQVELTFMGTKTKVCFGYSPLLYICLGCVYHKTFFDDVIKSFFFFLNSVIVKIDNDR